MWFTKNVQYFTGPLAQLNIFCHSDQFVGFVKQSGALNYGLKQGL